MSRTHNLPYSWQDNGEKWPFFYGILTLFLTFFIDCGHIYIPKGVFGVLSTSRPHRGDLVMSLIFTLGPTTHDWGWLKMVHFGPKMAKHGRLVNVLKWSQRVQKGPKWSTEVFLTIWDPFGPIWTLLDHFKQKVIFCSEAPPPNLTLSIRGKKFIFV